MSNLNAVSKWHTTDSRLCGFYCYSPFTLQL